MYYKGNLAKNKKQFDCCLSGRPFSFRLGAGEVIRGWDLGVAGEFYSRILLVLEIINLMESCFCSCLEFVPCFKYYLC